MAIIQRHSVFDNDELVCRIASFLPSEEKWLTTLHIWVPYPRNLVNCLKVNRAWRATLTPLLWIVFDAKHASQLGIPPSVIQANSRHIRYAKLRSDYPTPILNATLLRDLDVDFTEPMAIRDLTRSNPRLKSLTISLNHEFVLLSLKLILEPLAQLSALHLKHCRDATLDQIVEPLICLSRLTSLRLSLCQLEQIDTPLPQLCSVTDLVLGCNWARNPGQVQIVRCCPNLLSLQVKVEPARSNSFPSATLSTNLRECCPKLTSLQHHSDAHDFYVDHDVYQINHHEDLLKATDHLEKYQFPVMKFCTRFCDALLVHAPSLKTINIDCNTAPGSCWQDVGRLLSLCPNLVSIRLSLNHPPMQAETCLALFEEPWICSNLEELNLIRLYPHCLSGLKRRVMEVLYMQWDQEEACPEKTQTQLMDLENVPDGNANDDSSSDESDSSSSAAEDSAEESSDESDGSQGSESSSGKSGFPGRTTNAQYRSQRPTLYWTRMLANHPQPNPNFYQMIEKEGWTQAWSSDDGDQKRSRLEKIVLERVFAQVLAWPKIRTMNLGGVQFVKRGRSTTSDMNQ